MMEFWQIAGISVLCVILIAVLGSGAKEIAVLLGVCGSVMIGCFVVSYLADVIGFIEKVYTICKIDKQSVETMLKVVGIAITGEIAAHICADTGHSAQARMLQLGSTAVILWQCIPVIEEFLSLVTGILGEL